MRLAAWCLLASIGWAQKAPLSHETLWMMKRVSSPAVSPDGKWVVFHLTEPSYKDGEQVADLWIVPADGTAKPRRLTATKSGESGVAWSPDSRRIAFTAKREGDTAAQIYLLDLDGGEARRVTALESGAAGPAFSPDGAQLLFSSRVYPGAGDEEANRKAAAERKLRKYSARVYDSFPVRHWDRWLDDLQTHLFVQPIEGGAAKDLLAGTRLTQERGYGGIQESLGGETLMAAWAPDGQSIVFTATTNRTGAAYEPVVTRLYRAGIGGGEPQLLTPGSESYARPVFSPDGQWLYATREESNGLYSHERLVRFRWPEPGPATVVSARLDSSVGSFALAVGGKTVFVSAEEAGLEKIYEIDAAGGAPRGVTDTAAGVYGNLSSPSKAARPFLIATWSGAVNPAEIVRIDADARRHRFLTTVNTAAAEAIDWRPLRHFTFLSKRGRKIHNMLALPAGFDESKKYPLFVVIHGGPHTMWRDEITLRWNYHLLARPGYVVLLTNYTGSTGFGEDFARQIKGDPLAGPGEELNEAAGEALKRFPFLDGARQCAGGASYGGHLANWLQASTTRYRCLISHAGLINLESQWGTSDSIYHREVNAGGPVWEQGKIWREQNPIRYARNFKTPILLTVGENDFRVPLNQTLENWSVLQRQQVPSRLIVFPEANHWILKPEDSRFFYSEVHRWLEKYLKD